MEQNNKKSYITEIVLVILIFIVIFASFIFDKTHVKSKDNNIEESKSFYTVEQNNKWGIINNDGHIIIPIDYSNYIIVPNNNLDVFIVKYKSKSEQDNYLSKAINSKEKQIFTEYDQVEEINNYDDSGNLSYNESVLIAIKDGKKGLIDYNGKIIINMEYDDIKSINNISDYLCVYKNGKVGLAKSDGTIILDCNYNNISCIGNKADNGFIITDSNNLKGVINNKGEFIINTKFTDIKRQFIDGVFIVEDENKKELINNVGNIISKKYDDIIDANIRYIIVKDKENYGIVDYVGNIILKFEYQKIKFGNNNFIVEKNDLYGIIDDSIKNVIPIKYSNIIFHKNGEIYELEEDVEKTNMYDKNLIYRMNGILSEYNENMQYFKIYVNGIYKYFNFNFEEIKLSNIINQNINIEKKNGKYGLVRDDGSVVVDYKYDDIREPNLLGYIAVKSNGLWGCINTKGEKIIDPKYNLENNLIIDFIGQWHLSSDIEKFYYTDKEE